MTVGFCVIGGGIVGNDPLPYEASIRAQAVMGDGTPVHDFFFLTTERMPYVCNGPSPAAASAIPIGEMLAWQCVGASNALSSVVH